MSHAQIRRRVSRAAWVVALGAGLLTAPAPAAEHEDHPVIRPMEGFVPTGQAETEQYGKLDVRYRDGGAMVARTISGRRWFRQYRRPPGPGAVVSAAQVVANYEREALAARGTVHYESGTRLIFSLPRQDGGRTWCALWASDDKVVLDIVDEAELEASLAFGAEQMLAALGRDGRVAVYGLLFATDRADLQPGSGPVLDEVAKLMALDPALRLEVQGHTDATGTAERNRELSQQRAETVVRALALYGVPAARLVAKGYGRDVPVANNATDEGRRRNRRVELVRLP
jgi:outer membrane protein OmpA-like peptidoglycan-associated protein